MRQTPFLPETVYHVYTHANGFENLFNSDENYRYFLKKYTEYIYPIAETYAYCLMPNHLHLMIEIRSEREVVEYLRLKRLNRLKEKNDEAACLDENLNLQGFQNLGGFSTAISQQFSNLFNGYTKAINKQSNRKGSLFMPNIKRKEVTEDQYMTQLIAYIHNNPVHHGFIKELKEWPYSSFHAYIYDKPTLINKQYMYDWFGSKKLFVGFHKLNKFPEELTFDGSD